MSKIRNVCLPNLDWISLLFLLGSGVFNQVVGVLEEVDLPEESRLKKDLLKVYDSSVRPTYNTSQATRLVSDIALQQIINVDEKQQLLKATVWMRLYWRDEFLVWDPADYGGIDSIKLVPSKIWLPDICIYDALEPAIHANEMRDFYVSVDSEGNVVWLSPIVIQAVCHYNVRYFPYDTQFCTLLIGSWTYNGLEIDIWSKNPTGDTTSFKSNVEWEVEGFTAIRRVTTYSCCPEPYPGLYFTLTIKRKPGFYVTYLYIPSVVIIASSMFAFHLPPGSDAKVDLAVTGLLSQTVFLLLISDLMPPDAHNPPVLGKCLTILLVVQAAAVVVIVIIKRLHDDSIHKDHPPSQLLCTVMHYLKYPFLLHHIDYRRVAMRNRRSTRIRYKNTENTNQAYQAENGVNTNMQSETSTHDQDARCDTLHNSSTANGRINLSATVNGDSSKNDIVIDGVSNDWNGGSSNTKTQLEFDTANDDLEQLELKGMNTTQSATVLALNEILNEMRVLRTKRRKAQFNEDISEQWKHIAAMYDRILFVCFMIGIASITIWFLTLQPNSDSQRIS